MMSWRGLLVFFFLPALSCAFLNEDAQILQPVPLSVSEPLLSHSVAQAVQLSKATWHASPYQDRFLGFTIEDALSLLQPIRRRKAPSNGDGLRFSYQPIWNETERGDFLLPIKKVDIEGKIIPDSFDAREKWYECQTIGMIRDQGNCGACWAFGSIGTMSDRTCIATNGRDQAIISARDIMTCCPDCTAHGNPCDSGYVDLAFRYWKSKGIVTGGNWKTSLGCQPYPIPINLNHSRIHEEPPTCKKHCTEPSFRITYQEDKRRAIDVYRLEPFSIKELQVELMERGPVSVGMDVYQDFFHYTGGIYSHVTGPLIGGHEVRLIGWGSENGTDYWTLANSWNQVWGIHGFFRIKRGVNESNIESDFITGVADPDWKPTWEGRPQ